MKQTTSLVLAAVLCVGIAVAFPGGAPAMACGDMLARHSAELPQDTPSPYLVSVNPVRVAPQADVFVKISTNFEEDYFKGFFVQARDATGTAVGIFEADEGHKVIDCPNGAQNAATHMSNAQKTDIELRWQAPAIPVEVNFTFTILHSYSTYWAGVKVPLSVIDESEN